MAHVWMRETDGRDAAAADGAWSPVALDAEAIALDDGGTSAPLPSPLLFRAAAPEGERWVLLASPATRVNGEPVAAGIVVLRDRDELWNRGRRLFFSDEALASIAPHAPGERATFCPRCKQEIAAGTPAVVCPRCGVGHHQSDELPCWTYAARCALCDQPTALDAGFRWTPEDP